MNPVAKVLRSLMTCAYLKIKDNTDFPLKRAENVFFYMQKFCNK